MTKEQRQNKYLEELCADKEVYDYLALHNVNPIVNKERAQKVVNEWSKQERYFKVNLANSSDGLED
tara:strand:- start:174 stop:371 length:198 start_codon:yes stop_codon:yes gene_type:complete